MICTSTIKYQLDPLEEYACKTSLVARSPNRLRALHVSHKYLRNPNGSILIDVGLLVNILSNNFTTVVTFQHKA